MQKPEFKYGIYGGIAICIFKTIEFLAFFQKTRIESGIDTGLLALVLVGAIIILGVKAKRNSDPDGSITFLHGFMTGMIIAITIVIIVIPFVYVYDKVIYPHEAEQMNEYIKMNPGDYLAPPPEIVHEYYAPRHRSMETGQDMLLTGFIISIASAAMFKRVPTTARDFYKEAVLPSSVRRLFVFTMIFTMLPFLIYIAWLLKWSDISTTLFEIISDPIDPMEYPLALQEGTAFLSIVALALNFVSYNRIGEYGHRLNIWNMRMMLISIGSFLISLWLILH